MWRIKTEAEFISEFGDDWKEDVGWNCYRANLFGAVVPERYWDDLSVNKPSILLEYLIYRCEILTKVRMGIIGDWKRGVFTRDHFIPIGRPAVKQKNIKLDDCVLIMKSGEVGVIKAIYLNDDEVSIYVKIHNETTTLVGQDDCKLINMNAMKEFL